MYYYTTKCRKKIANKFNCEKCAYECSKKCDYDKQCLSRKHQNTTKYYQNVAKNRHTFICCCGKAYIHRSSLFNHKKICTEHVNKSDTGNPDINHLTNMVMELMKNNGELK